MASSTHEALVIGINEYTNRPLRWAVKDAKTFARTMQGAAPPYSTVVLLDKEASRARILERMRALGTSSAKTKILYMAGHAAMTKQGAYFISYGAVALSEMIRFSEIAVILQKGLRPGTNLVVILDCCHAGALEIESKFSTEDLKNAVSGDVSRPNIATILACTIGASAREDSSLGHGIFTFHLLKGILGGAADSDGTVTPESLYQYISKQLERLSYQKPAYKADLAGRLKIVQREKGKIDGGGASNILSEVEALKTALFDVDERLAGLRPPFASRDSYRKEGWQQAAKIVNSVAEKRSKIVHRWGTQLEEVPGWRTVADEVDSLLVDIANITVGTVTEFGPIVSKLGEGGFGTVFKVESGDGQVYAYKVYHPHELSNPAKLERFRIGYRAMDRISHPRIVKVSKFVESPLSFYMDYIDGQNLRRWFGAESNEIELMRIAIGVAQIVEYAHGMGVLHRDIKPENVILIWNVALKHWEPVLTDFDLAWFAAATSHTVEAFGAPFYAAPEQLSDPGKSVAHQAAVDVYALAMLVIFLLTGKDPVILEDALSALDAAVSRWKSQSAAQLLKDTLRLAGFRKPEQRTSSVGQLRDALVQVRARLLSTASPDALVDDRDFFNHVAATGGNAWSSGVDGAMMMSATGRTQSMLSWYPEGLSVSFQKTDKFLAQGVSTAEAKRALFQRVTERLALVEEGGLPNGVSLVRPRNSVGETAKMTLTLRGLQKTINSAALSARLIAELVSVYEQF